MTTTHLTEGNGVDSISQAPNSQISTMNSISKNEHKFNELGTKRRYFKKLSKIYSTYGDTITAIIWNEMLLQCYIESRICHTDNEFARYEVIQENGEYILIKKRNNQNSLKIRVLSAEECFSVILEAHKNSMHGERDNIINITNSSCVYPTFCIPLLIQSCSVCKEKLTSYTIRECKDIKTNKTLWKFSLHKMNASRGFTYLFIYMEAITKYVIIRPLTRKSSEHLGLEFMKIFLTFGIPEKILTSAQHEELLTSTMKILARIHPNYVIPIENCLDLDIRIVGGLLKKVYKENDSTDWEVGCRFIQRKLNTSLRIIAKGSNVQELIAGVPYNLFFGSEANAYNHLSGDLTHDQISVISRNEVFIQVKPHSSNRKPNKVIDQVVELSSDESDDEKNIIRCGICNEEFAMYTCPDCHKPIHYKCGRRIQFVKQREVIEKFVCTACTEK